MHTADPFPAVAGRLFYVLDRFAPPDEQVLAEEPVPGYAQLWVVRDWRGHRFVCPLAHLCDVPPGVLYERLRQSAA